ncbi:single-stranded DNA-binding protein WHY1, chloroplastic-like isoform X2 [Primulina eburnea]|uniref:single-stranded DNA-binding protein WHY1, chloroplastic-like isoform X2 n=1 Tax=Primulina eburnea TaxID=1245227 RepID=UPI003C6BDB2E
MVSLNITAPGGGRLSILNPQKLSSCNSTVPISILVTRSKNEIFLTGPHGKYSKNVPVIVKSQYLTPQELQQQQRFSSLKSPSPSQTGQLPRRVYVGYTIYKGKAALAVEPCSPEFSPLESGAFKLSKEGLILLQFAPAAGVRQYDWSRKQLFSLSVTEIGNIISLGTRDSCEFFHDPHKGRRMNLCSEEGKVRKLLKVEPLPDGSGHFFNLSVQNKLINVDENIYIPITKAEFAVLVSSFNFILPYLLGWHTFANSTRPEDASRLNNANSTVDYEWNR